MALSHLGFRNYLFQYHSSVDYQLASSRRFGSSGIPSSTSSSSLLSLPASRCGRRYMWLSINGTSTPHRWPFQPRADLSNVVDRTHRRRLLVLSTPAISFAPECHCRKMGKGTSRVVGAIGTLTGSACSLHRRIANMALRPSHSVFIRCFSDVASTYTLKSQLVNARRPEYAITKPSSAAPPAATTKSQITSQEVRMPAKHDGLHQVAKN